VTHWFSTFGALRSLAEAWSVYLSVALALFACGFFAALIERKSTSRITTRLASLGKLKPRTVRLIHDGHESLEDANALQLGQVYVVGTGERFPADGIVEDGNSLVDESIWTGDSSPSAKELGDVVLAGTIILEGSLQVRATHLPSDSTDVRSIAALERAFSSSFALDRLVDYANRLAFPAVIFAALGFFLVYWSSGIATFEESFLRGVSIALAAYPLALRLATRPVVNAAVWAASRQGVLIPDAKILETLERASHVVLDKTGTVTEGNFELLGCELVPDYCSWPAWMQANAANPDADPLPADFPFAAVAPSYEQIFELLASVEQHSTHPLGLALVNFACERGIPLEDATCTEVHRGLGITGMVGGRSIFVGGRRLIEALCVFVDARTELVARRWESEGRTVVFFGWDGNLRGCLAFGDKPRQHAPELIAGLKHRGIRAHLLSGDSNATTEAVARQFGAESCRSDLLPCDKADLIHNLRKRGAVVVMVGHAIDDAPALGAADAGIAIGSATDWRTSTSAVVLMSEDLTKISKLVDLAKKTMRTVRQNVLWAISCSAAGVALAVSGLVHPLAAALLTFASGFCVIANSMRFEAALEAELRREL
jgi:Cu+-exporting ATPase